MSTIPYIKRWVAVGLLATTTLALASPALAGNRRYKGSRSSSVERVVVRERSSNVGPVLAGLVGGFILGQAVANANSRTVVHHEEYYEPVYERRVVHAPAYRYYDPYGDYWYDSLDQCHFRSGGPQIVFVIDVRSGHRVRQLQYRHGRWNRWDGDYFATYGGGHRGYRYSERRYKYRDDDRWDRGRRYRDDDDRDRRKRRHRDRDDD
jgi:hypothetical protein